MNVSKWQRKKKKVGGDRGDTCFSTVGVGVYKDVSLTEFWSWTGSALNPGSAIY